MGAVPCSHLAPTRLCQGELRIAQKKAGRGREAGGEEVSERSSLGTGDSSGNINPGSENVPAVLSSTLNCWSLGGCWVVFL